MSLFVYQARLVRVIDGDTMDVLFDLGFHARLQQRIRLYDINTPEVFGADASPLGRAAREFAQRWFDEAPLRDWPLHIDSRKYDARGKFGRVLADVYRFGDGVSLNAALKEAGYEKADIA